MTLILQTERLQLKPITHLDAKALHALWTEPEVRRYLWDGKIIGTETVDTIIRSSCKSFAHQGYGFFGMTLKKTPKKLIGFCGHRLFEGGEQIELLYGVLPAFWGRGIGTEAARAALEHGFTACGIDRVIAATDTPNQRSVKVLQRLGMSFEVRREWHGLDTIFYSLTLSEYVENQAVI